MSSQNESNTLAGKTCTVKWRRGEQEEVNGTVLEVAPTYVVVDFTSQDEGEAADWEVRLIPLDLVEYLEVDA